MKSHNKISGKSRGVSPVIATVVLVAVTITVAVAVSYWMSGISSQYTKFEKIEIQSGWSEKASDRWIITMELKNSGTTDATLTRCFINDIPLNTTGYDSAFTATTAFADAKRVVIDFDDDVGKTLNFGEAITVKIYIASTSFKWASISSGTTINIKLHSAAGMDYIRLVPLV